MQSKAITSLILLPMIVLSSCSGNKKDEGAEVQEEQEETVLEGTASNCSDSNDSGLVLHNLPYNSTILTDADGDINTAYYSSLYNKKLGLQDFLSFHYHRVGCSSDTCKQEFVTLAAVQYPKDTLTQKWLADVLGRFYYDATRELDIQVNGEITEDNGDGETETKNVGCNPYTGPLNDDGKAMFDYYQTRLWTIGSKREPDVHGPGGRYTCVIYQCWQSHEVSSWFVAYSTNEPQWPVHYVVSFDRRDGHMLTLTDIIKEDYIADFKDLLEEASQARHYVLRQSKSGKMEVDDEDDYSAGIQPNYVGFTEEGLAVSTGALPFDQITTATHILIIPYDKVDPLLQGRYIK